MTWWHDPLRGMPILLIASAKTKIVYLNMPKSGCTSIKNWIYWLDYGQWPSDPLSVHWTQSRLFLIYDDHPEKFRGRRADFTFTFVRHPLRRAYATFIDKFAYSNERGPYWKQAQEILRSRHGVKRAESVDPAWHSVSFVKFLEFVEETKTGRSSFVYDKHWAEQSRIIAHAARVRKMDFVGKLENLQTDFLGVAARAGVETIPPRLNERAQVAPSFAEVVNDDIRALGGRIYAKDFAQFGYNNE